MRDFVQLFDDWAPTYDQFVAEREAEVFDDYEDILETIVTLVGGRSGDWVLDIGTGTGNLARQLTAAGYQVVGVDPSREMRRHARAKLAQAPIVKGSFLTLPVGDASFRAAVSSYAFHHLTDPEKEQAAAEMLRIVAYGGRIITADVAYENESVRDETLRRLRVAGRTDMVDELEAEYYACVPDLVRLFEERGCQTKAQRLTEWVWVVVAQKPEAQWFYEI